MQRLKQKHAISIAVGIILCSLLLLAFVYAEPTDSKNQREQTPTLFIHGYKGGPRSFQTMLQRMEHNNWAEKAMVIHVAPNGDIVFGGRLAKHHNPLIQVIFAEDKASIAQQTIWIEDILYRLKNIYEIDQVNIVGHSMGGLTATNTILQDSMNKEFPHVEKLVVIASPFKGIDKNNYFKVNKGNAAVDLRPHSQALTNMIQRKTYFPPSISVLAIAGVSNNYGTDGLVRLDSAMGIEAIVNEKQLKRKIFYNKRATHSGLHELEAVDQRIATFLWENTLE
ncbi:alpha/beta fold hydrolase [Paraliobacillus ryukyuensis]|uniref:alpha/beta fold hydrolase n=1 Tax=Paraliobacillus ryukyuensis TaxID=200904 RepID=UPI0009A80B4A|nr:alpha/beta fold hydrolase [Paraliobacillus ryukyuensis]